MRPAGRRRGRRRDPALRRRDPVEPVALEELIRNGKYADVLKVWNLESEGIETSQINPPGLPNS